MYFLSGLPRSGSTVLAAILNQNPLFHVTATSGLLDVMGAVVQKWETDETIHTQGRNDEDVFRMLRGMAEAKYSTINKKYVIDKSRGWANPTIMKTVGKIFGAKPKIIATVRSVPDCAASFVRVVKPKNLNYFLKNDSVIQHLKSSYISLLQGYESDPECFCIIEYENLLSDPKTQLQKIHKFLDLPDFDYNVNQIEGSSVAEKDEEIWNIPNLHKVESKLAKQHSEDSKDVLKDHYQEFCQPRFWLGEDADSLEKQPIDLQLEAAKRGDFVKAREIALYLKEKEPNNNRAAYNRGLYTLMDGDLQGGMELLNRGRMDNVFGDRLPSTPAPIWDGESKGTVFLRLEGGLGDQIQQVMFAKHIAKICGKVIVGCTPELVNLLKDVDGVTAIAVNNAISAVYHDYWVPGMSAVCTLGWSYSDVKGEAYIQKPKFYKAEKIRIGLRWQGNPVFEHDHNKYFPAELMFNAVQRDDIEFISLQRDEGSQHCPEWVKQVKLDQWTDTQEAIASCDLVISSCTSVAHLSGAMGVPTWVVTPILPYFLWAIPGEKTPWYDSVRLFRQTKFENWTEVFNKVSEELSKQFQKEDHGKIRSVR